MLRRFGTPVSASIAARRSSCTRSSCVRAAKISENTVIRLALTNTEAACTPSWKKPGISCIPTISSVLQTTAIQRCAMKKLVSSTRQVQVSAVWPSSRQAPKVAAELSAASTLPARRLSPPRQAWITGAATAATTARSNHAFVHSPPHIR